MKKVAILIIAVALLISGCQYKSHLVSGSTMEELKNQYTLCYSFSPLSVFQADSNYLAVLFDAQDKVSKAVEYTSNRKVIRTEGLSLLEDGDIAQYIGTEMQKLEEEIGVPHFDSGSGFYIPAYMTENGYFVEMFLDDAVISKIVKRDIFTGIVVETVTQNDSQRIAYGSKTSDSMADSDQPRRLFPTFKNKKEKYQ